MKRSRPCCQFPDSLKNQVSPFRIVALGFYDGPTSGILQCQACEAAYKFEMLDWDDDHRIRVFRLAALPAGSFGEAIAILAQSGSPHWPLWVPPRSSNEEIACGADQGVECILARAQPADFLIAWEGYGERILAATKTSVASLRDAPDWFSLDHPEHVQDWFSLLNLVKSRAPAPQQK